MGRLVPRTRHEEEHRPLHTFMSTRFYGLVRVARESLPDSRNIGRPAEAPDWANAHSIWSLRAELHDADVRARAQGVGLRLGLCMRLRAVQRLRVPRGHLALRRRRDRVGSDCPASLARASRAGAAKVIHHPCHTPLYSVK